MAMSTPGGNGLSAEMNVTPMIDVLLVLIIIFMIITPIAPQGENALIPQPDPHPRIQPPDPKPRTLIVQVLENPGDPHPQLKINQEDVVWPALHDRLYDILKLRAEKVVFILADKDVEFEVVAQVIDAAHQAGADKVGLMTGRPGL
jgi:biopolymer transport protein TolR